MKSHLAFRRGIRSDELPDGVKDEFELLVVIGVFGFERLELLGEQGIGVQQARRSWTKVRMMAMFTSTARGERRTLESMATPCSVKA